MNTDFQTFEQVKHLYPDEWVLLGDPQMKNTTVLGGIVIYHSKDKREVCYLGKDKTQNFATVTIAYAGNLKKTGRIGILKRKLLLC